MPYENYSIKINNGIRDGNAGVLNNNGAVRNYARTKYAEMGLNSTQINQRMDNKDAGHIRAKNVGGQNRASNYMWEDRHDNRAHGDSRITKSALKRGGRL